MSMYRRVTEQFEHLVARGVNGIGTIIQDSSGGYIMGVSAEGKGTEASLSLVDYDRYSVILRHLEVTDSSLVINGNVENYLHQCAAEISRRLAYLEEPLVLLELDTIEGIAQLRSSPPEQSSDGSTYWEMKLWVDPQPRARLTRYRWRADSYERSPLAHPITFATLARIAEDLAASVADTGNRE